MMKTMKILNKIKKTFYHILWSREQFVWACKFFYLAWNDWMDEAQPGTYRLLKLKLEKLEYHLREHGRHVGDKKDADRIHELIIVLNRIIMDQYRMTTIHSVDNEYGVRRLKGTAWSEGFKNESIKNGITEEEHMRLYKDEMKKRCKVANSNRQADKKWFLKVIMEESGAWWN